MAQQGTKKATENEPVRTRSPRVGGGKKPVPADYSRGRHTFTDPHAFMVFMKGYPNTVGITLYLYRVMPKIDLSLIGHTESNIQKGGYEDLPLYSIEAVTKTFGRGIYQIKVVDSNRAEGDKEVVRACTYDISDTDKPAVYDLRTLKLSEPKNNDEINRLIVQGVLVRDAATGAPRLRTAADIAAVAPVAAPVDTSANGVILQFAMEAFKSTRQSPSEAVKDMVAIAQAIQPKQVPGPSIEQIADAVVVRLGGAGRGPASDPFANWEKVNGFIARAAEMVRGSMPAVSDGAAGDGGGSWAPHLGGILSEVRALVPEVLNAWYQLRASGSINTAPAAAAPGNGVLEMLPLDKRIETIFKAGFESMQRGITGQQFAAWLCLSGEMPGGLEAWNVLKPAGAVGLIAMASTNPMGARMVNDPALASSIGSVPFGLLRVRSCGRISGRLGRRVTLGRVVLAARGYRHRDKHVLPPLHLYGGHRLRVICPVHCVHFGRALLVGLRFFSLRGVPVYDVKPHGR